MAEVVMPRLSDSMEEGTVLRWLKSVGDEVAVGEELVEIETDKADMVYESDAAGTLVELVAAEGDTLPIGEVIAKVGEPGDAKSGAKSKAKSKAKSGTKSGAKSSGGEAAAKAAAGDGAGGGGGERTPAPPAPEAPAATPAPAAPSAQTAGGDGRLKASPIARRIAMERGLDLAALRGSGPGGRIVKADVEAVAAAAASTDSTSRLAAAAQPPPPATAAPAPAAPTPGAKEKPETAKGQAEVQEPTKLQQAVARRMAESKATAPHFYLRSEIDMSRAVEARARLKASADEGEIVPTFNDMVIKACALALRDYPRANGAYRDGRFELYSRVNVGVAVAAQDALVVPTVFDADRKGLREIAAEVRALASRVRDGSITPPELSGGTFTVSNLGMFGISNFDAVINPPQAGILAIGELKRKPVFEEDGELAAADLMNVSLACDHRILYGADGARFLGRIRELLEEPLGLAL